MYTGVFPAGNRGNAPCKIVAAALDKSRQVWYTSLLIEEPTRLMAEVSLACRTVEPQSGGAGIEYLGRADPRPIRRQTWTNTPS